MNKETKLNNASSNEPIISTYLHQRGKEKGIPVSGTFELTSRCNFNCKMCYVHSSECNHKKDELSADWWIETGKKAVQEGMIFLLLTGGEPLIRDDFPYIYTELKKLGLVISINTNGYLLSGKIAELFEKNPPSRINVSLYGSSDDIYEKLTGVRGFSTVIKNIEHMRSLGIEVRLNCSLAKENYDDMEGIFETANRLNLHIKTTPYMYPQIRTGKAVGENDHRLDPVQAAKCRVGWSLLRYTSDDFINRAQGMKKGIDMFEKECIEEVEPGKVRCRAGKTSCWVDKEGKMSLCGLVDKSFDIKTLGFAEAWRKVKEYTESITLPIQCTTCKYRHFCNVCAAVCYTETGSFSGLPEFVCRFSEETAKITQQEAERLESLKNE
jgi:radical SAM protein with 4Fe4S-binding SPASM domain